MQYPIPKHAYFYRYINESPQKQSSSHTHDTNFSRSYMSSIMAEYIEFINKTSNIFRSIPFIKQVYLCNSITFNALHENSDIDICIVTEHGYLWYARLWSWILLTLKGLKRWKGKYNFHRKLYCLSFYIDELQTDISFLRKRQGDIYLSYRLAHNVLLYSDESLPDNYLFSTNKKLLSYLPDHPDHQTIDISTQVIYGKTYPRKRIEYLGRTRLWKQWQNVISWMWWYSGKYKTSLLSWHTQQEIIISDTMLKFHQDKRDIIQHKRNNS